MEKICGPDIAHEAFTDAINRKWGGWPLEDLPAAVLAAGSSTLAAPQLLRSEGSIFARPFTDDLPALPAGHINAGGRASGSEMLFGRQGRLPKCGHTHPAAPALRA